MATPKSAVTDVKVSKRGRNPAVLPGGKPLAEARNTTRLAVAAAKADHRTARDAHKASAKALTESGRNTANAEKAIDQIVAWIEKGRKFATKADGRAALSAAKALHKTHVTTHKGNVKAEASALKNFTKAGDALKKAEQAKLAVEAKRLESA